VLHRRGLKAPGVELTRGLASGIQAARLVLLEGTSGGIFLGDTDAAMRAIDEFLGDGGEPVAESVAPIPSGTAIILFADIVDSTALTEQLGDTAFREKARELDASLRAIIRDDAGTPIEGKLLGDGVLAVFTIARRAIEAALACGKAGDEAGLPLHLGIHAGDVIREENNVYGGAVNIASRIAGLSAAGEVLVSETVRSLARTSAGVGFEDRGEQELKGVGEKVRVWAVVEAANQQTDKPANQDGA
jgi:class 3 adenylate cyclase